MFKDLKIICSYSFAITTGCFSFIPDASFNKYSFLENEDLGTATNKILFFLIVSLIIAIIVALWKHYRNNITLSGHNYKIIIEYGDIFEASKCKKVINFDECYSTEVGDAPHQIKPSSVCGQFLRRYPNTDITALLKSNGAAPEDEPSKFNYAKRFKSGTILPNGEYMLMAFGKLNKDGRTELTREEYLESLKTLWKEFDKYYTQEDVVIPVLGAGVTRFKDEMLSQQQLVDIIVASYRLNPYKIKKPNALHIVCKKVEDFSLNNVGDTL